MNAIERRTTTEDIKLINGFPAQECGHKPAKPKDMVKVAMRKKDAREVLETAARLQNLALRALTTIDQKPIFIMLDNLGRKAALRGWC